MFLEKNAVFSNSALDPRPHDRRRQRSVGDLLISGRSTNESTPGPVADCSACAGLASQPSVAEDRAADATPTYRIYPLRNGSCEIAGNHAFHGGDNAETYEYALYLWLVLGGEKAHPDRCRNQRRGRDESRAAHVLRKPITQDRNEHSRVQLAKFGLTPEDIGHVLITHLHFDHVDDLLNYTNAKVYVGKKEWLGTIAASPGWGHGKIVHEFLNNPQCKNRLVLVEDELLLPGIESFWIGGHTPGSTAYSVNTAHGKAVLTGDTVSLLANFERNVAPGVYADLQECMAALKKIRARADIVLPSHDPATRKRWPPLPSGSPKYTIRASKSDSVKSVTTSPSRTATSKRPARIIFTCG